MWSKSIKPTRTKVTFNKTNNVKLLSGLIVHSFCEEKGLLITPVLRLTNEKNNIVEYLQEKYFHSRTGNADVAYAMRIPNSHHNALANKTCTYLPIVNRTINDK